jgi:N6-adenosine-specific RNA methylase IME4
MPAPAVVLAKLNKIVESLPTMHDIGGVKALSDQIDGLKYLAKKLRFEAEIQNRASEASLYTKRRLGELIPQAESWGGDRKSNKSSSKLNLDSQRTILKRLELSKSDAYRCIQLSKPAEKDFLKCLAEVRERDGELSTFSVLRSIVSSQRGSRSEPVFAKLPPGKFNLIYADPPWEYSFITNSKWAVENHYPTLTTEQLCEFPISKVAAKDSILFLWATSPKLADAMQLIQSWGFNYRSSMVWVKNGLGMGYYARQNHEFLLIATKGNWPVPPPRARPPSVITANRTRHSTKPEAAYEILEKMYPKAKRIELFCRKSRAGWASWGNELELATR